MDELLSVLFCSGSVGASHDGSRLRKEKDGEKKGGRKGIEGMEELVFF